MVFFLFCCSGGGIWFEFVELVAAKTNRETKRDTRENRSVRDIEERERDRQTDRERGRERFVERKKCSSGVQFVSCGGTGGWGRDLSERVLGSADELEECCGHALLPVRRAGPAGEGGE